jgi:hypothetical protein
MTCAKVSWFESALIGLSVFGLVGTAIVLAAGFVAYDTDHIDVWDFFVKRRYLDPALVACAVAAAAVTGTVLWRAVVRRNDAGPWRGLAAGLLTGVVCHPVFCLFFGIYTLVREGGAASPGRTVSFLSTMVMFSGSSLVLYGWVSAPAGMLLGFMTQAIRKLATRRRAVS